MVKEKSCDYVNKYKEYLEIDFDSKKYQIHHIDTNRKNNKIYNLVLLPKELHQKYHKALNKLKSFLDFENDEAIIWEYLYEHLCFIRGNRADNHTYIMGIVKELLTITEECDKWYDKKTFRLLELGKNEIE